MLITDAFAAMKRRVDLIAAGPFNEIAGFNEAAGFNATVAAALDKPHSLLPQSRTSSHAEIDRLVASNAVQYSVDPALIEAIIANESGFDPRATSVSGARGLMQLMPQTAEGLGITDAYDPAQNVRGGTKYLRGLLDRFGDVELAVAAYNAGPAAVARYGGVPPFSETQQYVRNVLQRYRTSKLHG